MSGDASGFEPPAFNAAAALLQLQRALRDLKLSERGNAFELRGRRVIELSAEADSVQARIARKPALTPEWDRLVLRSTTEQRKFIDDVKKRLARWARDE